MLLTIPLALLVPEAARPVDADLDGVRDEADDCLGADNGGQRDTDGDGLGNLCDADFDEGGFVLRGVGLARDALVERGLGARIGDSGLDALETALAQQAGAQLRAAIQSPTGQEIRNRCIVPDPFGGCLVRATAERTAADFSDFSLALDAIQGRVAVQAK